MYMNVSCEICKAISRKAFIIFWFTPSAGCCIACSGKIRGCVTVYLIIKTPTCAAPRVVHSLAVAKISQ